MKQKTTRSSKNKKLFTLRQRASFALASAPFDSSSSNYQQGFDTRIATQHFHKLTVRGGIEVTYSLKQEIQKLLKQIRNYSSHAFHDDVAPLSDELISFYKKIEWQAREELFSRIAQGKKIDDTAQAYLTKNEGALFNLSSECHVNHLPQPEIAFLLAPFLTVGELHLLLGKIYFGKDAYDKDDDGNRRDKPLTAAIKQLLISLSAPDSIIVRSHEEGSETWLAPKHEQAFAIYENLRENYPIDSEKQIPDQYMMRQLLLFIEHHNILEGCRFARTKTTLTERDSRRGNDLLTQEITFENDKRYPYHIRLNTIRGRCRWKEKNDDPTADSQPAIESEGTFSLKLLMAIVAVYLKNNKAQDINKFVTNWFETNKDYGHRTLVTKSQETLPTGIEERLKHLIREQEKPPRNLHAQIRFICHIWRQQNSKRTSLSKHEYKILEDKVRYFNKDELRDHLQSIWQKTGIGLGRDNDKALGNTITKDRLQDVYSDLSDAWIDYLKGEQERLSDEISEDALQQITTNIGFRKSKS